MSDFAVQNTMHELSRIGIAVKNSVRFFLPLVLGLASCGPPQVDEECGGGCTDSDRNFCQVVEKCDAGGNFVEYEYICTPYVDSEEKGCDVFIDQVCIVSDNGLALVFDECF